MYPENRRRIRKRQLPLLFLHSIVIVKQDIIKVAELKIKELDGFLVDVKVNTNNIITIFFDRMEGVRVEHCSEVSKYVEQHFDREVEDCFEDNLPSDFDDVEYTSDLGDYASHFIVTPCDCADYAMEALTFMGEVMEEAEEIDDMEERAEFMEEKEEEFEALEEKLEDKMDKCDDLADEDEDFEKEAEKCIEDKLEEYEEENED